MAYFKSRVSGQVIEVTEEHASQVLRPQGKYIEVEAPKVVETPKKVEVRKPVKSTSKRVK